MFRHPMVITHRVFLVVTFAVYFSTAFHPITVQNYATVSDKHLLGRFRIRDWLKCTIKCQKNPRCFSYNYRHRQKRQHGALCELFKCGLDRRTDFKQSLFYSLGIIFQQLRAVKYNQYCTETKARLPVQKKVCRNEWIKHGKSCYKAVDVNLTWQDASNNCYNMKSNLTSVLNKAQNEFVVSLSVGFTRRYFWIGFVRNNVGFEWIDGSSSSYTKWLPHEPSSNPDYDCVNIKKANGMWKNWNCFTVNPSICKYDLSPE